MFYIDAHCDSVNPVKSPPHLDARRMCVTQSGIQFTACFSPDFDEIKAMLDRLDSFGYPSVLSAGDIVLPGWRILRSVEGGDCLDCDDPFERLEYLYKRGVRSLGLTWNNENLLSGGAHTPDTGLTELGAAVILRMEDMGMLVDLAHISQKGFWDAMSIVRRPPIVSHTAANALHSHLRNLSNAQIKAVARAGGVIGVCLCPDFLGSGWVTIDTVLRHFRHIKKIGGADCVGIGTDFDGVDTLPKGINSVEDIPALLRHLDEKTIGLNFARVLKEVL